MKRIRETLDRCFDEYVMSDELSNLKEEILANATDHYSDLIKHGESEEDAENTVLDSLGDLKALLRELGAEKKEHEERQFDPFGSDVFRGFTDTVNSLFANMFQVQEEIGERSDAFANIEALDIHAISMDIHACHSEDAVLHVNAKGNIDRLSLEVKDGTLYIVESGTGRLFSNGIRLFLSLPAQLSNADVHLASGDFSAESLHLDSFRFQSVSGDLSVKNGSIRDLAMKSTSGDIFLNLEEAHRLYAALVSGDAEISCTRGGTFALTSISGDIEIAARKDFESILIKTRSGDVSVTSGSGIPVKADLGTISGSLRNDLSAQEEGREVNIRTITGDILLH